MWSTPEIAKETDKLCEEIKILKLKIELEKLTQEYDKLMAVRKDTSKCEKDGCKGHKPKPLVTNRPRVVINKPLSRNTEWIPSFGPLATSPTESDIEIERKKCQEIYGTPRLE